MNGKFKRALAAAMLAYWAGWTYAAPMALTDAQMDEVSAGGQYSLVSGGAYAEQGTVMTKASTKAIEKPNGSTVTKATLKVKAVGTDLAAYGAGESAAGDAKSSVYGEAYADQGKIVIKVKTVSRIQADGDAMTKSKIQIRVVDRSTGTAAGRATF